MGLFYALEKITIKIFEISKDLPENWNTVAAENHFLQFPYLKVLELSAPANMQCLYIGIYENAFTPKECEDTIKLFENYHKAGYTYSRLGENKNILNNKDDVAVVANLGFCISILVNSVDPLLGNPDR